MNHFDSARPPGSDWTAQQVLTWMDSFRALMLEGVSPGVDGLRPYDRIRDADPMRSVRTGHVSPAPTVERP